MASLRFEPMRSNSPDRPSRRSVVAFTTLGIGSLSIPAKGVEPFRLEIGGGRIDVSFASGDFDAGPGAIRKWISDAAHAVAVYYGRFPVQRAVIEVRQSSGRAGVFGGVTYSEAPARTKITVGQHTSVSDLEEDWTMTHELTHMCFPSVPRQHHWIEEGIATYVEPVARAQAGTLSVEKVWEEMLRDIPKGQPGPGDRGLDQTHTWANTYWGGALFCLFADVRIRERTGNKRGLQDALRAILKAGGNIETEWPLARALQIADDAVGVPVLTDLYLHMRETPVSIDLPGLWRRLGVSAAGRDVTFRDGAELSAIRTAITTKPN